MFQPIKNLHDKSVLELEKVFNQIFDGLAIRHSYYYVFDNFLDCALNGFCFDYDLETMETIRKRYNQDERYKFGELIKIWIVLADKKVKSDKCFYDFFGNFYELNAMSKQKGFAQFFTPEHICKLMVALTCGSNSINQRVYEPACGSGRFNLAIHSENPTLFHVANDLDITCAKMSALNFMLHGIKGIVTCDDALLPRTKFRGAFVVNEFTAPMIRYIDDLDKAYEYINRYVKFDIDCRNSNSNSKTVTEPISIIYKESIDKKGQLTLF